LNYIKINAEPNKIKINNLIKMKITTEQFNKYEAVRESGLTNMFNVRLVSNLSGLTNAQIFYIMKNYKALKDQAKFDNNLQKYKDFIL
tara:strand:+ start:10366 stop:10629 length:264 start_codon:yes stop_codon:yes gene_type:complete